MADATSDATVLRDQLVSGLEQALPDIGPAILRAFRLVPRHLFVPDSGLAEAYRDDVIFTKSQDGISLSASSAPSIMAEMLELLDVRPGQRVLEIGAGTGYNAALLDEITGPAGQVVTLDIDEDVVWAARAHLRSAGRAERILLKCSDGALGWPDGTPYQRIIVTVGVWDIPRAWFDQLAPGGRLVVPLEFQDVHKLVTFERRGRRLVSVDTRDCRFVRPRGALAGPVRQLPLSAGSYLSASRPEADLVAIEKVLRAGPTMVAPLPVIMTPEELHGGFRLWLALTTADFCLLSLEAPALRNPHVRAWQTTAARAVVAPDASCTFASVPGLLGDRAVCLLERAVSSDREPVLCGYGEAQQLADRISSCAREWDSRERPFTSGLVIEAIPVTEPCPRQDLAGLMAVRHWFRYVLRPSRPAAIDKTRAV